MFQIAKTKFSEMKNKEILDRSGQKIGRVIDFHFSFKDGNIELKSIVMGGGRIEEFLESVGLKKDIDPFYSIDVVDRFENDQLHLKVDYQKLTEPVKLGKDELLLSDLAKCKVIDVDDNKIGKINDVIFDEENRPWFIVAGGFFEELFERLKIRPDIDPLVPPEFVTKMTADCINLKLSKMQLETTAQKEWERYKRSLTIEAKPSTFHHRYLWMGRIPPL